MLRKYYKDNDLNKLTSQWSLHLDSYKFSSLSKKREGKGGEKGGEGIRGEKIKPVFTMCTINRTTLVFLSGSWHTSRQVEFS